MPTTELVVTIIGNTGSGKSALAQQFAKGDFSDQLMPTIGFNLYTKQCTKKTLGLFGTSETVKIWDMGGQDKFHSMMKRYSRGAVVILAVDLTDANGLAAIEKFHNTNYIDEGSLNLTLVVATKADKPYLASVSAFKALCAAKNLPYIFTSAKLNYNLAEVFQKAFELWTKAAPVFANKDCYEDYTKSYKISALTHHLERAEVVKTALKRTDLTVAQKQAILDNQVAVFDETQEIKAIPEDQLAARWTTREKLENKPEDKTNPKGGYFSETQRLKTLFTTIAAIQSINPSLIEEKASPETNRTSMK